MGGAPMQRASGDLLQPLRLARALDAGEDIVARDGVPAHLAREVVAAVDELLKLLRRARQALDELLRDAGGDVVLDLVALLLADRQELLGAQALVREVGVVGDDDVGGFGAAGRVRDEAGAAAALAEDADAAEADRF